MMQQPAELMAAFRRMTRLYDRLLRRVGRSEGLGQVETVIIAFLHNNPGIDTAKDIAELRQLPKGSVSQGVESLIQRGYLLRRRDKGDRRLVHLEMTEAAAQVCAAIDACQRPFYEQLFQGFAPEELAAYGAYHRRVMENVIAALERMEEQ